DARVRARSDRLHSDRAQSGAGLFVPGAGDQVPGRRAVLLRTAQRDATGLQQAIQDDGADHIGSEGGPRAADDQRHCPVPGLRRCDLLSAADGRGDMEGWGEVTRQAAGSSRMVTSVLSALFGCASLRSAPLVSNLELLGS